jgi:hypothetical protein
LKSLYATGIVEYHLWTYRVPPSLTSWPLSRFRRRRFLSRTAVTSKHCLEVARCDLRSSRDDGWVVLAPFLFVTFAITAPHKCCTAESADVGTLVVVGLNVVWGCGVSTGGNYRNQRPTIQIMLCSERLTTALDIANEWSVCTRVTTALALLLHPTGGNRPSGDSPGVLTGRRTWRRCHHPRITCQTARISYCGTRS